MALRLALIDHPQKTYKTYDNAVAAITRECAGSTEELRYMICSTPAGRFYPVILPAADQITLAVPLAHRGFPVVRV